MISMNDIQRHESHDSDVFARDLKCIGSVSLFEMELDVYFADGEVNWATGCDQGFNENGATCEDPDEYGIKIWKRGVPMSLLEDGQELYAYNHTAKAWTEESRLNMLDEIWEEMSCCYGRQKDAEEAGIAPPTFLRVLVIHEAIQWVDDHEATPVWEKDTYATYAYWDKYKEENDVPDDAVCDRTMIKWYPQRKRVQVPMLYVGYETGVADTSCSYDFPVQDEHDPYGCYYQLDAAHRNMMDIIYEEYEKTELLRDEDGELSDFLIDKMWTDAEIRCMAMKHHCPNESFLTDIWNHILEMYEPHEMDDRYDIDWDLYEALGMAWVSITGQYDESENLTEALISIGQGGDLHTGNIGMWNGEWVAIDFSAHCVR